MPNKMTTTQKNEQKREKKMNFITGLRANMEKRSKEI
jgi:hypothetical protein